MLFRSRKKERKKERKRERYPLQDVLVFICALVELARRAMWNLFRLELEQYHNTGKRGIDRREREIDREGERGRGK